MSIFKNQSESHDISDMEHCVKKPTDASVIFTGGVGQIADVCNLVHCGSYACVMCSYDIKKHRFDEVKAVVDSAISQGYSVASFKMSVSNEAVAQLDYTWSAAIDAWNDVIARPCWSGTPEQNDGIEGMSDRLKIFSQIRTSEVARVNGWWEHRIHTIVIFKPLRNALSAQRSQASIIANDFHIRWNHNLSRYGLESSDSGNMIDVVLLNGQPGTGLVTMNVTQATMAETDFGCDYQSFGETVEDVMVKAVNGDSEAIGCWQDFAATSYDKQLVSIPHKLRKLAGIGAYSSDQAIASKTAPGPKVAEVSASEWIKHSMWERTTRFLAVLENGGPSALFSEFEKDGIKYTDLTGAK